MIALILFAVGCQQTANTSTGAGNVPANNAVDSVNAVGKTESAPPVSADSPTAAYIAAYNARKDKDIPKLRSLMSKDILEFFELIGEEEKRSVDDMLRQLADRAQANVADVRNENIKGDKATIEYLDEEGQWRPMDLVKEDGSWKLTFAIGDPEPGSKKSANKGSK